MFYWLCYYSCAIFLPYPCLPSTPHSLRQSPHHCSCPWVMHVSSLATPSTVLYFTSPWLFCNYLVVWPHVVGVSCMVQWHSLPYHPSWVLEVQPPCGLSTPSSCNWALVAIGRSMGGIYKGQVTASIGSDHWSPTSNLWGVSALQG